MIQNWYVDPPIKYTCPHKFQILKKKVGRIAVPQSFFMLCHTKFSENVNIMFTYKFYLYPIPC